MVRKAFNFYSSYYETAQMLDDKNRLAFYDALIKRQFTGEQPELSKTPMANFAYISQKHSIDTQILGWEHKTKLQLSENNTLETPIKGGLAGGIKGGSVQEKEKEKGEEKEKEQFEKFRILFEGTKRGLETEFENFKKKHKDYKEVIPHLCKAIEIFNIVRNQKKASNQWIPEYPNLSTWINQRRWEEEIEEMPQVKPKSKPLDYT